MGFLLSMFEGLGVSPSARADLLDAIRSKNSGKTGNRKRLNTRKNPGKQENKQTKGVKNEKNNIGRIKKFYQEKQR